MRATHLQDGCAKARTRHIELLQKGITAERKGGHTNLHGVKLRFGTFLVSPPCHLQAVHM